MKKVNEGKWNLRAQSQALRKHVADDFSGRRYVRGLLRPLSIMDNYVI
jgi:hypothetical protein